MPERDDTLPPDVEVAALRYDTDQENAPKLVARGRGHTAQRILELAKEHDLPIRKDPTLVSILGALDVGAEIPPDLYGVIAEVLAWAYHSDQQMGQQRRAA
jgi:flagellar biosynthesis protein